MDVTRVDVDRVDDKVTLDIEVGPGEVKRALGEVYRDLSREVKIPGFRKGKAPPMILKQRFGDEIIGQLVADRLVPDAYKHALKQADVMPIEEADVDVVECKEGSPLHFKASVGVRPEAELGEYRGIPAERRTREVPEQELEQTLEAFRHDVSEWVATPDHPADNGDRVVGTLSVRVRGKAPADGQDRELDVILGQGQTRPPIDAELLGVTPGETRTFPVRYPGDFGDDSLAGKDAEFEVCVAEVRVLHLPELDDDFAKKVAAKQREQRESRQKLEAAMAKARQESPDEDEADEPDAVADDAVDDTPDAGQPEDGPGVESGGDGSAREIEQVETLEELRALVRSRLEERSRAEADSAVEEEVIAVAVGRASVEVPEAMLERELESRTDSLRQRIESRGIDFDDYLIATGQSMDDIRDDARPDAERLIRRTIVLDTIAKQEEITVSDGDVEKRVEEMAQELGLPVDAFREHLDEEGDMLDGVRRSVSRRKVVEFLVKHATIDDVVIPAEEPEGDPAEEAEPEEPAEGVEPAGGDDADDDEERLDDEPADGQAEEDQ